MISRIRAFLVSPVASTVSRILTGLSLLAVGAWLFWQREALAAIQWGPQWRVLLGLVGMYGLSLILNFVAWHSCLRLFKPIPWLRDLEMYAYANLSRRLPSGLGYLFVRAVRYRVEGIDSRIVLYLSTQELVMQVVTGVLVALLVSVGVANVWIAWALMSLLVGCSQAQ